jgi:superfamily II DNA or RNA helicase
VSDLWPHQQRGIGEVTAALLRGERRVLVTSPTGGGKTRIMADLIWRALGEGKRVVLYTNRRLLREQLSEVMHGFGLQHGVRASGHFPDGEQPFQVSSIQTEGSRVLRKGSWGLYDANLALIDEAHCQVGETVKQLLDAHIQEGASYVGFTATPLGLAALYDCLVVAGTASELRRCGALVPCLHYGPDEPDLRHIGKVALGEDLSEQQNVKAIMTPTVWGRVYEWWKRLNPQGKPTILFAPGVKESLWFAEQFQAQGVSAAHIDGQEVWVHGEFRNTSPEARREVLEDSKAGRVKVVCNRFVLREGIDAPWLGHGVLATVFGSLQSYLQAGGRLLRAHPGIQSVVIQDHGGNWHRHGSLNADREWRLDDTPGRVSALREERLRQKKEAEPFRCPGCGRVWVAGTVCREDYGGCGYELCSGKRSRPVVQVDGSLQEMFGDIYTPRTAAVAPDTAKLWERMYWRARKSKRPMSFRQAEALFFQDHGYYPPRTLPFMPREENDWFRKVSEVPFDRLIPKPPKEESDGKDQEQAPWWERTPQA